MLHSTGIVPLFHFLSERSQTLSAPANSAFLIGALVGFS